MRRLLAAADVAGVVLTRPGPVAWATGGMNPPIDRTAPTDTVWLVVTPDGATVITTEVEAPRVEAELLPGDVNLEAVPWWDAEAFVAAAATRGGLPAGRAGLRRPPRHSAVTSITN